MGRRRAAEGAVFSIIMALSFSHFLNDMMQSLVPALYPMLKGSYGLSFAQIGLITLDHAVDLVVAAAGDRPLHRSPAAALFARDRHGRDPGRPVGARPCRQLCHAAARGDDGRHRLRGVPPRSLAGGANGVGRAARPGAVAVPGRRQYRLVLGTDPGRLYRDPEGSGQHRLVLAGGAVGDDGAVFGRQLVPPGALGAAAAAGARTRSPGPICRGEKSAGRW